MVKQKSQCFQWESEKPGLWYIKISCVTVNVKDKLNRMIIQVRAKDWPQMHTLLIFNWHYGNFHYRRFLQLWRLSLVHLHLNLHSHYRHSAVRPSPYLSISQLLDFHKSIQPMNNTWWCYGCCLEFIIEQRLQGPNTMR